MTRFFSTSLILCVGCCLLSFGALHAEEDLPQLQAQFTEHLYPLFNTATESESCVQCHDSASTSDLVFHGDAAEDFQMLLQDGYLHSIGPDSLLGRIVTKAEKRRMPKKGPAWEDASIDTLKAFLANVENANISAMDEQFPRALLGEYKGSPSATMDNQFLSYRQLRSKVNALFGRSWQQGPTDLFEKNIAMFGGADFKTRFNESTQASSNFLTGLSMVARDMVTRAYTEHSGPFAQRAPSWNAEVDRLYQHFIYRLPTDAEQHEARQLFDAVMDASDTISRRDYDLAFELTVEDPFSGMNATADVRIPVRAAPGGVYQKWIDQSAGESQTLAETVRLTPNTTGQRFILHNDGSFDNVSFAKLTLQRVDSDEALAILANDPAVKPIGSWSRKKRKEMVSFEDEGRDKGLSRIEVDLQVPQVGDYRLTVHWRESRGNAPKVFAEVIIPLESLKHHAESIPSKRPPAGEAHYFYDSSEDAHPYFEPPATFQFTSTDSVTVSNADTDDIVTVGALEFISASKKGTFEIDSREADGQEGWSNFKSKSFGAYNQKGTSLQDDDKQKGELSLTYRPKIKTGDGWDPSEQYRLHLHYPGKRGHETRVPMIVKATRSSPVIQLAFPPLAHAGGTITIDATSTYTVQQSPLTFHWKQVGGPPCDFDPAESVLSIKLPTWQPEPMAWQALARALMRHPDFLFTRPPSLADPANEDTKHRLQLVKLAQDLLGRPPTREEFDALKSDASLSSLTESFLQSKEFEDFYFHRIRLYLESQGTATQDEPARLWSYIAFNDRPFQEILTSDYTVDEHWQRQSRPAHHGQTGVLTTTGFIQGKPGLPHYNYAAQVSMLFLGYVYEVPPEIVEQRENATAAGTTDPQSTCYSCHKILTPLAHQRNQWTDDGKFLTKTEDGLDIDASDQGMVDEYPFKGVGLEAFTTQAVKKERFIRTIIDTHFSFYFGRQMRFRQDERSLYRRTWDAVHSDGFKIRTLIRTLVTSPEYLEGTPAPTNAVSHHE
ncbi:MAG: hypothetical protein ACI8T1_003163 [Verrucomicrobiales bacterium]